MCVIMSKKLGLSGVKYFLIDTNISKHQSSVYIYIFKSWKFLKSGLVFVWLCNDTLASILTC